MKDNGAEFFRKATNVSPDAAALLDRFITRLNEDGGNRPCESPACQNEEAALVECDGIGLHYKIISYNHNVHSTILHSFVITSSRYAVYDGFQCVANVWW